MVAPPLSHLTRLTTLPYLNDCPFELHSPGGTAQTVYSSPITAYFKVYIQFVYLMLSCKELHIHFYTPMFVQVIHE